MRKLINGKHAARFPLWKPISKYDTQYPVSSFKADRTAIYRKLRICSQK